MNEIVCGKEGINPETAQFYFRDFRDNYGILVEAANQLPTGTLSSKEAGRADCGDSIIQAKLGMHIYLAARPRSL
jgi:hypothetical protein